MTKYEATYSSNINTMLRTGSFTRDGKFSIPCSILHVSTLESFPILVYKQMSFDEILNEYELEGNTQLHISVREFTHDRNNIQSFWSVTDGHLNCSVMLVAMDYINEVPYEIVKLALDMHKFSEQHMCKQGDINVMLADSYLRVSDWISIENYISDTASDKYSTRSPVNPKYSQSHATPKLLFKDGAYELTGYPTMEVNTKC